MKANIHPKYYSDAQVICACGNKFITGSTKQHISVEVCSKCHPIYTGEHRFVDIKGRVDVFQKKQKMALKYKSVLANKKLRKEGKKEMKVKSLKELLGEM
jgi:large subunit ribosomal protein L31